MKEERLVDENCTECNRVLYPYSIKHSVKDELLCYDCHLAYLQEISIKYARVDERQMWNQMRNKDVGELYEIAYNFQYNESNLKEASEIYKAICDVFSDVPEIEYARTQIQNIEKEEQKQKPSGQAIILTTSYFIEGKRVTKYMGIISAEAVMGVNIFRDMFSGIRDVIGGRSASYQKELRKAKELVLNELRNKARRLGANAVIGVDLDYNQLSARGKSSLMVVSNGTAVVVKDEQDGIKRTNELLSELLDKITEPNE